jgi:hypothetical protein
LPIEEQSYGFSNDDIRVVAMEYIIVIHIIYAKPEHFVVLWHLLDIVVGLILDKGEERYVLNHNGKVILIVLLSMQVDELAVLDTTIVNQKKDSND